MTKAAMTPGTQPQKVKSSTIKKDPQPFPMTANGGKSMANKTRIMLIRRLDFQLMYPIGLIVAPFVT